MESPGAGRKKGSSMVSDKTIRGAGISQIWKLFIFGTLPASTPVISIKNSEPEMSEQKTKTTEKDLGGQIQLVRFFLTFCTLICTMDDVTSLSPFYQYESLFGKENQK